MADFLLSAFADEAGGGILSQIEALKANGFTHREVEQNRDFLLLWL